MKEVSAADKEELQSKLHSAKKFILRYVLLMVFLSVTFYSFCAVYHVHHKDERYYYLRKILGHGLCISRLTATVINFSIVIIIFPVCKTFNKLLHKIFCKLSIHLLALYLEKLKVIHQCLALILVYTSVIHSIIHIANAKNFIQNYDSKLPEISWARDDADNIFRLIFLTPVGFSGWTMVACLIIIWTFSTRQMREYFYNSFLGVHHLFLLLLVMMYYHPVSNIIKYQDNVTSSPPTCDIVQKLNTSHAAIYMESHCTEKPTFAVGRKNFWIWPSISLSIYLFDLVLRYFKRFFTRIIMVSMHFPTDAAIFLTFRAYKNISIRPGQYVLLQCENLSTLEWHPFTITDFVIEPKQATFTLAIAVRGDWTSELYKKALNFKLYSEKSYKRRSRHRRRKTVAPRKLIFVLDGPFPSPMESIVTHERVVLVGVGIGVTPFISTFNYIMKTTKSLSLKRIHFIWMSNDIKQFTLFADTLCDLTQMFWDENQPDRFQISFYLSHKKENSSGVNDDESLSNPEELFGRHTNFITSRIYNCEPNWNFLFNYWSSLYGRKRINIFSCGPKSLYKDLKEACNDYCKKGFNYHILHQPLS
ncbi:CLUMA_CG020269, isoform A [Clunio marinus]|uniref:CLUMA_CG020269, isoform A n=1 Tax=Clunio marinus TaxID=568069 RepID=A0A1J1J5N5_9DIPT|nr:CLUMA_CG020269, isoform A [Clunio marinus]